ncbi:MAG TPA: helix-turn-helix domain-containing protein [Pyrinomonadaceae bacterium]|nr:helix-turn-helix domain-containing protein [Pyrinomonadaceae bacterium]
MKIEKPGSEKRVPVLIQEKDVLFPRSTLWRLRKTGQLPFYKIGRRVYYSAEHLLALLEDCEQRVKTRKENGNE